MILYSAFFMLLFSTLLAGEHEHKASTTATFKKLTSSFGPAQLKKVIKLSAEAITKQNPKVIFLGENHNDLRGKEFTLGLTLSLAKALPHLNCFLVEEGAEYQFAFDLLALENRKTAEAEYQKVFYEVAPLFRKAYGREPIYWIDFSSLEAISRSGMRIWAADRSDSDDIFDRGKAFQAISRPGASLTDMLTYDRVTVIERNEVMARRIINLLENKACSGIIFTVGSAHVFDDFVHFSFAGKSVPNLIGDKSFKVYVDECKENERNEHCNTLPKNADLSVLIGSTNRPTLTISTSGLR